MYYRTSLGGGFDDERVSLGYLNNRLKMTRKDETGTLGAAMDSFSDDLQEVVI